MENKYYVPEIEDLFVGYECEFHGMTVGGVKWINVPEGEENKYPDKEPTIPVWYKWIIGTDVWSSRSMEDTIQALNRGQIRTPFLSKEQIETEGWEHVWYEHMTHSFQKGALILTTFDELTRIKLNYTSGYQLFDGKCPSINEFRKICKLLGV